MGPGVGWGLNRAFKAGAPQLARCLEGRSEAFGGARFAALTWLPKATISGTSSLGILEGGASFAALP